jgi:hypothetical protein
MGQANPGFGVGIGCGWRYVVMEWMADIRMFGWMGRSSTHLIATHVSPKHPWVSFDTFVLAAKRNDQRSHNRNQHSRWAGNGGK